MPKLAIQEALLPGITLPQRLQCAAALGISAVEFPAAGLDGRIDEVDAALAAAGISACGISMGARDGWLAADIKARDAAADALRRALTSALDLGADYVAFVPHYGKGDLPDLSPAASPCDLQRELLIWLLRGASDLAAAMDAALAMLPVNRYESAFLTRLDAAASLRQAAGDHPNIRLAASTFHAALEEPDLLASLRAHAAALSALYLADSNGRLPGEGYLPFAALGEMLAAQHYSGWLVLGGGGMPSAAPTAAALSDCLAFLRRCGLC